MKKRVLVLLVVVIAGMASTASAALKHHCGNEPIIKIEKNQRGGE